MTSNQIRKAFLEYFESKGHKIVPSAPMVIKNDPSLMFTNAGMNQFKDVFLANSEPASPRIANSQKCLRVSGKHNDLEEVGHDTYHHTMFEMLGNWSFGEYFKEKAIEYAWDFLTNILKIEKNRLYVTVFEGDQEDKTDMDMDALQYWKKHIPESHILKGSKKDNFWEMGETGPCGPCSEIHADLRNEDERKALSGSELVNKDHPLVIEIWNLVFIQYNRKANGELEPLPNKHVDTGMGFERLCMVVQGKLSNYDTDIFRRLIDKIAQFSGKKYGQDSSSDTAMRVIADHLRAVSFSITDGQLPSNAKAGYVIRRILRRAVRYAYTFLEQKEAFMYRLVPELTDIMGESYPELVKQQDLIEKVIREEELAFLRTLEKGIGLLEQIIDKSLKNNSRDISGKVAFELYDTYGFPLDLTQLIVREHKLEVNLREFENEMHKQKSRSREDAAREAGDWTEVQDIPEVEFLGYDKLEAEIRISRYRKINQKGKVFYQLVFDRTPFYAESGGQVGDKGFIDDGNERVFIIDTIKENNLIIHLSKNLPKNITAVFQAVVNSGHRVNTAANHSATHLLHHALRSVLGDHVEQKGSLVHPDYLRFDFSHFQKPEKDEIREIEKIVNDKIRQNIPLDEKRSVPMEEARSMGAMALFGEKYGEEVRVVRFSDSIELCGGTHVQATGQIGFFKIVKESAIAAGIRRIEAITGSRSQEYIFDMHDKLNHLREVLPVGKDPVSAVENLLETNSELTTQIDNFEKEKLASVKRQLKKNIETINGINFIGEVVDISKPDSIRDLAFQLKGETEDLFLILGAEINSKANLSIMISDNLVSDKGLNASSLIREFAREIKGGGGGQPFFATAGGKDPAGLHKAIEKAREHISRL